MEGGFPSGFFDVEAQTNGNNRRMRIRSANIVAMREGNDGESTVLKLGMCEEVTVNMSWDELKCKFEP